MINNFVLVLSGCKNYLGRVFWASYFFKYYDIFYHFLSSSLACSTLYLISICFIMLWVELYLAINLTYTESSRRCAWIVSFCIFLVFAIVAYAFGIILVYMNYFQGNQVIWILYGTCATSIFVVVACLITGSLCVKYVKIMFHDRISGKISKNLKVIMIVNLFIYSTRSALCMINLKWYQEQNLDFITESIFIVSFYLLTEIIPLLMIILYFQPEIKEEDNFSSLPSVLFPRLKTDKSSAVFLFSIEDNSFFRITSARTTLKWQTFDSNPKESVIEVSKSLLVNLSDC